MFDPQETCGVTKNDVPVVKDYGARASDRLDCVKLASRAVRRIQMVHDKFDGCPPKDLSLSRKARSALKCDTREARDKYRKLYEKLKRRQ